MITESEEKLYKRIADLELKLKRYDQAPNIPFIKGGTCNTTHSACDCIIQRIGDLEARLAESKMETEATQELWEETIEDNNALEAQIAELEEKLASANAKFATWQAVKEANAQVCKERNELKAKLAEHEWVSVEDRLPKDGDKVFCFQDNWKDHWGGSYNKRYDCFTASNVNRLQPTHWKPVHLPEAKPARLEIEDIKPATFRPECKWQEDVSGESYSAGKVVRVTYCRNIDSEYFNVPCSKRCKVAKPDHISQAGKKVCKWKYINGVAGTSCGYRSIYSPKALNDTCPYCRLEIKEVK